MEPEAGELRLPAEATADAFLAVFFARSGGPRQTTPATTEELVDLFLYGAVRPQPTA
ncbi:MAG TPA: hypothetical protein VGB74_06375 [Actinoplanes sp.]